MIEWKQNENYKKVNLANSFMLSDGSNKIKFLIKKITLLMLKLQLKG
jgi:hypothetical protein